MSISEAFEARHYEPGYVYIAGSLSGHVIKIGTCLKAAHKQGQYLRTKRYGGIDDSVRRTILMQRLRNHGLCIRAQGFMPKIPILSRLVTRDVSSAGELPMVNCSKHLQHADDVGRETG